MIHIISSANAQDYYRQGEEFLEAAWRCYGKKKVEIFHLAESGKIQQLPAACAVNAVFSCEMFLKSLLIKMHISYDLHTDAGNLYLLFKKLPENVQDDIAKYCGVRNDKDVFENVIKEYSKEFADIRSFIEYDGGSEMSPIIIIAIADSLSKIVGYFLDFFGQDRKLC